MKAKQQISTQNLACTKITHVTRRRNQNTPQPGSRVRVRTLPLDRKHRGLYACRSFCDVTTCVLRNRTVSVYTACLSSTEPSWTKPFLSSGIIISRSSSTRSEHFWSSNRSSSESLFNDNQQQTTMNISCLEREKYDNFIAIKEKLVLGKRWFFFLGLVSLSLMFQI